MIIGRLTMKTVLSPLESPNRQLPITNAPTYQIDTRSIHELGHHVLEFAKVNLAVSVLINLCNQLVPHLRIDSLTYSEHLLEFSERDASTTVLVVQIECGLQLVLLQ